VSYCCVTAVAPLVALASQVSVNGTNVGAGVFGVTYEIEVDGVLPDVLTIPVRFLQPGGIANPGRAYGAAVLQHADRVVFLLPQGRGVGLTYQLVVRDEIRWAPSFVLGALRLCSADAAIVHSQCLPCTRSPAAWADLSSRPV
jgi:hypothetical protein